MATAGAENVTGIGSDGQTSGPGGPMLYDINADIDAFKDGLTITAHAVTEAAEDIRNELTDTVQQSLSRVRALYEGDKSISNQLSDSVMERGLLAGTAVGGSKVAYTATRDTAGIAAGAAIGTSRALTGAAFESGKALSNAAMKTGLGKEVSKYSDKARNSGVGKSVSDNVDIISRGLWFDKMSAMGMKFIKKSSTDDDPIDAALDAAVDGMEQKTKAFVADSILGRLGLELDGNESVEKKQRRRRRGSLEADRIEAALDYDVDQKESTPGRSRERYTGVVDNRGELVSRSGPSRGG